MTPYFFGNINNGKLILGDDHSFRAYLGNLEGKEVQVSVRPWYPNRSDNQNRYYWGVVVEMAAKEFGTTPQEAHAILGHEFLTVGVDHNGKRYEYVRSTAPLSTAEFTEYVEKCRMWLASEWNLVVPDPNQYGDGD